VIVRAVAVDPRRVERRLNFGVLLLGQDLGNGDPATQHVPDEHVVPPLRLRRRPTKCSEPLGDLVGGATVIDDERRCEPDRLGAVVVEDEALARAVRDSTEAERNATAAPVPLRAHGASARRRPLLDRRVFDFREDAGDREHALAHWRARIELLRQRYEPHADLVEIPRVRSRGVGWSVRSGRAS
jgi:hypothetical protein